MIVIEPSHTFFLETFLARWFAACVAEQSSANVFQELLRFLCHGIWKKHTSERQQNGKFDCRRKVNFSSLGSYRTYVWKKKEKSKWNKPRNVTNYAEEFHLAHLPFHWGPKWNDSEGFGFCSSVETREWRMDGWGLCVINCEKKRDEHAEKWVEKEKLDGLCACVSAFICHWFDITESGRKKGSKLKKGFAAIRIEWREVAEK